VWLSDRKPKACAKCKGRNWDAEDGSAPKTKPPVTRTQPRADVAQGGAVKETVEPVVLAPIYERPAFRGSIPRGAKK
jgi:hypothetical protein